ncbi:beta-N-acetylhexosaminidase [Bacillus sp. FJAT-49705]|uniref:Beta-N-acetylhexosaminidase n=1 Tax=Cytobacillus citreus TaxID=2833586 RepID=A0ABS5NXF2_9BACI|nr:beta-N-acetylhexosaminidase [Cytobacillus citreus]MBS4192451.1 beta-N-acetylhexosaminidase [Cytobacillus citreus]
MDTAIKKKVGQLMVFGFYGKEVTQEIKTLIRDYHLGSIILFGRNIGTPEEVLKLTIELQKEAKEAGHKHPLLICTDQENGAVRRLGDGTTVFPGAMLLGATNNPENAYKIGNATGKELKALGINWNLSPVLDVNNNPKNPVIGVRSFGETPENVSEFGQELMKGMQRSGVMTTLKHFPGHGDTNIDSHLDLPIIDHDLERLQNVELKPFKDCISNGADAVMTAHVYFPAIESRKGVPATLSDKVITGLLRDDLHFDGVVTTDCMEMNAISETIGTPKGAVEAIKAGADLIMVSHSYEPQINSLEAVIRAVETGEIPLEQINSAHNRVEKLKEKYLDWNDLQLDKYIKVPELVGCKEHHEMATEIYRQGVTIVKNEESILPIEGDVNHRVLLVYPENTSTMAVEDKRYSTFSLGECIKEIHQSAIVVQLSNPPTKEEMEVVSQQAKAFDTVIVATLSAQAGSSQTKLVEKIYEANNRVIVVATRSPYDLAYLPNVPGYICTYEFTTPALKMAASAIYGRETVEGRLPVSIPQNISQI